MTTTIETVIVGGGQAGLVTSWHLNRHARPHVILEQADAPASAWRDDRWASFTLVTPNWMFNLPGAPYDGPDPDGFMPHDEVVARLTAYAVDNALPVQTNTRVTALAVADGGYRVTTSAGTWQARNVVLASGLFQQPRIPPYAAALEPAVLQLPAGRYRRPDALPDGAVLVIGSAQSGCQIVDELVESGRRVFLATGTAGRAPRRYRGHDIFYWLTQIGFLARPVSALPSPRARFAPNPVSSGRAGGRTLNLHSFARAGVTLLGHARGGAGGVLHFADDLAQNLTSHDQFEQRLIGMIDGHIARAGLDVPAETLLAYDDGYHQQAPTTLDLAAAGITTIIWACGYSFDFSWLNLPVLDEDGYPQQTRGVTALPGLYFVGLPWLDGQQSGLLGGVGAQAAHVVAHLMAARATGPVNAAAL